MAAVMFTGALAAGWRRMRVNATQTGTFLTVVSHWIIYQRKLTWNHRVIERTYKNKVSNELSLFTANFKHTILSTSILR